jgi:hypothetical protein
MKKRFWDVMLIVYFAVAISLWVAGIAYSADRTVSISFQWEQAESDLPQIDRWELFWSETSGANYTGPIATVVYDAGLTLAGTTDIIIMGDPGAIITKYFVIRAVSKNGIVSGFSNEVSHDFQSPLSAPFSFSITFNRSE